MPKVQLNTYRVIERSKYSISIDLGLDEKRPSKTVEIKTVDDVKAAVAAFAEEMKATGQAWQISPLFDVRSGRKPKGYDKAKLDVYVNLELAPFN